MSRPRARPLALAVLAATGCTSDSLSVLLRPELPPDLSHVALLRFDESGFLIGSTGLLTADQLPLRIEDEESNQSGFLER